MRVATVEDARSIASVHVSSWEFAYSEILPEEVIRSHTIESRASFWSSYINDVDTWPVYVMEDGRDVIGFASVIPTRDEDLDESDVSELAAIYLERTACRSGNGAELLQYCCREALIRNRKSMVVWLLDNNMAALKFYRKHGFVRDGFSKYEERLNVQEIRMQLEIQIG